MSDAARLLVLFSGGGTAGHLAPGFALARALSARGIATHFATPGAAVERAWFAGCEPPWTIPAPRLPRSPVQLARFPAGLVGGVARALRVLRRERVGCVVALGGWPCVPAVVAARMVGVPLVFVAADAVPGVVVRRLARWAGRVYAADEAVRAALGPGRAVVVCGPLLRAHVLEGTRDPAAFGLRADRRTLFVTGGSLGAQGLYERFLAGFCAALTRHPGLASRVQVLHAVGARDPGAADVYRSHGVAHHVTPFIHDMGTAYRTADLVLCRAGANTCAELEATATAAVLVPYPHHADRQQFHNAAPLVEAGGARLLEERELTPERIADDVLGLLEDAPALERMRGALRRDDSDAAGVAAADLIRFLGWEERSPPAPTP